MKFTANLKNESGFSVLLIVVAQIVVFTMFFALSPLQNQLNKLVKSNREFEVAHLIGEELGAKIGEAYYDGFNTFTTPADSVAFCEGIEGGVIPRRGTLLKLSNVGSKSGDYVYLCIPDEGIKLRHPLSADRLVVFGKKKTNGTYDYDNWLRLVENMTAFANHKKIHKNKMNLLINMLSPVANADDANLIPGVVARTNVIDKKTSARITYEPISPLPLNAIIIPINPPPPGMAFFPGFSEVENINCDPNLPASNTHHCIAFKFCTRINQESSPCTEDEFVWQMVALPKLPKETSGACGAAAI